MAGSVQFEWPPGVSTEAWLLYEKLPRYTLSKAEISATNALRSDIHTHRSYRYNGWDFDVAPGVFMPGETSRIIYDRILDGTIQVAGKRYAGVGVGLGVEAILAGVCGSREVFAMDVHPDSVQAAATHYHRLVGDRAGAKFHALVSDLFDEFPDSAQVDVVTFNPPAINEHITNDPDMVRNLCMGTEVAVRFFRQIAERDILATGGDIFLVISNTSELREIVGHALTLGFSPEVVHAQTWDGENVRTYLFRFQSSQSPSRACVVGYPGGDLRNQLAHVGAEAVRAGLVIGSGGNLSARSPGSDQCWITATGSWLDRLGRAEFSLIRISDGAWRAGHPNPSSEWRLHTETYLRRPDVNAIIHLHPQTSVLLAALGHDVALITTHHAYYLREVVAVPFDQPGSVELAVAAAEAAAGGVNVLVLGYHGCSVLADSVELAHKRAINLEEAARMTYAALLLNGGQPGQLPQVPARFLDAVGRGAAQV